MWWHGVVQVLQTAGKVLWRKFRTEVEIADKAVAKALEFALKDFYSFSFILDNIRIGNLKRKNRDHKKVSKQDEDAGNL